MYSTVVDGYSRARGVQILVDLNIEDLATGVLEVRRARFFEIGGFLNNKAIGMPPQITPSPELAVVVMTCDRTPA